MAKHVLRRDYQVAHLDDTVNGNEPAAMNVKLLLIDDVNLHQLRHRPSLGDYVKQMIRSRHFVYAYARSTAFSSGRGMFLGPIWILLNPLLQVAVFALVFGVMLNTSRGIDNFLGYLFTGVIFFGFLTSGLTSGSGLIQRNRSLVSSFNFPRAAIPFAATIRFFLDNLVPAVVAVVLALLCQFREAPSWTVLLVPIFYIQIHLFALGAMLLVARMTAFVPDLKPLVSVLVRGLFFISGIFFTHERFESGSFLESLMIFNPFYQFLTAVRTSVLDGEVPSLFTWLYLAGWTLLLLVVGFVAFWSREERYAQVK